MADVTLHIDEDATRDEREDFRDYLLAMDGVMAVGYHEEKSHLMIIEYDPETIKSLKFVEAARERGLHAELIGL